MNCPGASLNTGEFPPLQCGQYADPTALYKRGLMMPPIFLIAARAFRYSQRVGYILLLRRYSCAVSCFFLYTLRDAYAHNATRLAGCFWPMAAGST